MWGSCKWGDKIETHTVSNYPIATTHTWSLRACWSTRHGGPQIWVATLAVDALSVDCDTLTWSAFPGTDIPRSTNAPAIPAAALSVKARCIARKHFTVVLEPYLVRSCRDAQQRVTWTTSARDRRSVREKYPSVCGAADNQFGGGAVLDSLIFETMIILTINDGNNYWERINVRKGFLPPIADRTDCL